MKNKFIVTVLIIFFIGSARASETQSDTKPNTLTAEDLRERYEESRAAAPVKSRIDVEKDLEAFEKFNSNLYSKRNQVGAKTKDLMKRYMSGDKYRLKIFFSNTANYPRKYVSRSHFRENESNVFYEQTSKQIFTDILGSDYAKYSPSLGVVSDELVGMQLLISDSSELEELLSHPLAYDSRHIGNPEYLVEILP